MTKFQIIEQVTKRYQNWPRVKIHISQKKSYPCIPNSNGSQQQTRRHAKISVGGSWELKVLILKGFFHLPAPVWVGRFLYFSIYIVCWYKWVITKKKKKKICNTYHYWKTEQNVALSNLLILSTCVNVWCIFYLSGHMPQCTITCRSNRMTGRSHSSRKRTNKYVLQISLMSIIKCNKKKSK